MIRQFIIYLNFLQIFFRIFVSTRGPLQGLPPTRICGCSGALNTALLHVRSGQIVGERGRIVFPFRFRRGNAVPVVYKAAAEERGVQCKKCTKFNQLILRKVNIVCHQMSHFKAKMHQIVCRLELRPRSRCGSLQLSFRPLARF